MFHENILLPASKHSARERMISRLERIIPPVGINNLEIPHIQPLLRLIEGQHIDGEEFVLLALILVLPVGPAVDAALATEVFINVLRSHLVVADLGLGAGSNQFKVCRRDSDRRVALFQADGAVAFGGHWQLGG